MKYLIEVTETYRVDSEHEAAELIAEAKRAGSYVLTKYTTVKKERKQKGEIVDEWFKVTLVKKCDDEKEPTGNISIEYTNGAF